MRLIVSDLGYRIKADVELCKCNLVNVLSDWDAFKSESEPNFSFFPFFSNEMLWKEMKIAVCRQLNKFSLPW